MEGEGEGEWIGEGEGDAAEGVDGTTGAVSRELDWLPRPDTPWAEAGTVLPEDVLLSPLREREAGVDT